MRTDNRNAHARSPFPSSFLEVSTELWPGDGNFKTPPDFKLRHYQAASYALPVEKVGIGGRHDLKQIECRLA